MVRDAQAEPISVNSARRTGRLIAGSERSHTELEALGVCLIAIEQPYNSSRAETRPLLPSGQTCSSFQEIQRDQREPPHPGHARNRISALPPPESALRLPTRQDNP